MIVRVEIKIFKSGLTKNRMDIRSLRQANCRVASKLFHLLTLVCVSSSSFFVFRIYDLFLPIDRDGTIDMVFPSCSRVSSSSGIGTDCYINIAYNQQLPLCNFRAGSTADSGNKSCRSPNQLCVADPEFKFDLTEDPENNKVRTVEP